tara:strand:+ start:527 stop:673 length:147 start_codon:yes stop_codon:yes gene_type:complete
MIQEEKFPYLADSPILGASWISRPGCDERADANQQTARITRYKYKEIT